MVWKIVQGYMTTKKVMESINDITIEVTDQLPSEVTLSTSQNIEWPIFLACFLLMAIVYYGVRTVVGGTGK